MARRHAASPVLEPEVASAILEAFEAACDALRARGRPTDNKQLAKLAATIIELAERATRCPTALKSAALEDFDAG